MGTWKVKKALGSMVHEQVFLKDKEGSWHFCYLIFSRFIIFKLRKFFTLWKIVLYILRKNFFSATTILWKKIILSCLKMNLCVCIRKVIVSEYARRWVLRMGEIIWNTLKGGRIEKQGVETKILKRGGGQAGKAEIFY